MKNLKGREFGRLTVKEYAGYSLNNSPAWICDCSCGNEKTIRAESLLSGDTKSCCCLHAEAMARIAEEKRKLKYSYVGKKFTFLEAIGIDDESKIICRCKCGNIIHAPSSTLDSGKRIACSRDCPYSNAYRVERIKKTVKAQAAELIGKRFNKLKVLEFAERPATSNKEDYYFRCSCECGNETVIPRGHLGITKSCGCEAIKKAAELGKILSANDEIQEKAADTRRNKKEALASNKTTGIKNICIVKERFYYEISRYGCRFRFSSPDINDCIKVKEFIDSGLKESDKDKLKISKLFSVADSKFK